MLVVETVSSAFRRLGGLRRSAAADQRGIALQTVIIMVVLVVIAGAVTAVLITRAGEETDRLENVSATIAASRYPNEALCEMAGHTWTPDGDPNGSCGATGAPQTPAGDNGDGAAAGTFRAQWSSDSGSNWASTDAAKTAYDAGEADSSVDNNDGAAAGMHRAQWSSDSGLTWASTDAARTAYDEGEARS